MIKLMALCSLLWSALALGAFHKHVVFIGIDGLGSHNAWREDYNGLPAPKIPTLNSFIQDGAWTKKAQIDRRNFSGPNWMGILTGSVSDEHGVKTNSCERGYGLPTIFKTIKEQNPDGQLALITEWDKIKCYPEKGSVDYVQQTLTENHTTQLAIKFLKQNRPDFLFVYYGEVDTLGHQHGGSSQQYTKKLEQIDEGIAQIIEQLKLSNMYDDTLIIVTADHGHHPTSGGHSSKNHPVPFLLRGPNVIPGEIKENTRNNQLAPLVAYALGLQPSTRWSSSVSPFDQYLR